MTTPSPKPARAIPFFSREDIPRRPAYRRINGATVRPARPSIAFRTRNVVDFGEPSGKAGSSAVWFKGTTFGTWLKDKVPGSRVFAISGKDRASILMAGPKADGVYWFQDGFGFTTSTAYAKALPDWLVRFNTDC